MERTGEKILREKIISFLIGTSNKLLLLIGISSISLLVNSCNEVSDTLAPYSGTSDFTNITVEQNSYNPKLTWVGGYVSVVAANKGFTASLDSNLMWIVYQAGDNIHYPVTFGEVPAGASNLISQYSNKNIDSLSEDETYTFWVMKEKAWNTVSSYKDKIISVDSSNNSSEIRTSGDTVFVSSKYFFEKTVNIDRWINIKNVIPFGSLAKISVTASNSNNPLITWQINDPNAPDSLIAAVGISEGQEYQSSNSIWEVYSIRDSSGTKIYGKDDIISSPVVAGQTFPNTTLFVTYPQKGLERGKNYYVWIANKNWDGETRLRFAKGYAYATFTVY